MTGSNLGDVYLFGVAVCFLIAHLWHTRPRRSVVVAFAWPVWLPLAALQTVLEWKAQDMRSE
jgi:hypothetical protein